MTDLFQGYTEAELSEAFAKVAPADDWRGPIDAMVEPAEWPRIYTAIKFYTATEMTVAGHDIVSGKLLIVAAGYRAGPAGP